MRKQARWIAAALAVVLAVPFGVPQTPQLRKPAIRNSNRGHPQNSSKPHQHWLFGRHRRNKPDNSSSGHPSGHLRRFLVGEIADGQLQSNPQRLSRGLVGRTGTRTRAPCAINARTTVDPGNPDPPVTSVSALGSRDALMQNYLRHGEVGGV